MKAKTLGTFLFGAGALLSALPAAAQEVTLKVHHWASPRSNQHVGMLVPWCEKIMKESNNRIKCDVFHSMQLGGAPAQLYDQARDGVADVVFTIPGYTAGRFPMVEAFELPFMMSSPEATSRALWEYTATVAKDEFKDTRLIATTMNGPCNIYTAKKPVTSQADLRGLKVRSPSRQTGKMLAMLGATPVGMPLPGIPEALSKGVIDGAVVPYEIAPAIKLQELSKYVAETDRAYPAMCATVFVTTMNMAKYNSMPADLRAVIDRNSGIETSGWFGRVMTDGDVTGKQAVVGGGVAVNAIPAAELERWKKATASLDDQWVSEMKGKGVDGAQLLQTARELIKKNTR